MNQDEIIKRLFFNSPGNIYFKDTEGRYLACNQNQLKLVGFSSLAEIVNKTDYDLYPKPIADKLAVTDQEIMNNGLERTFEEYGLDINGYTAIYITKKTPVFDENNQLQGLIGTSFDITKEKQAERAKEDFLSNMQHDLRTPFSGISGIANLLYLEEQDNDKKSLLKMMIDSCSQWERIHHRIFDALSVRQQDNGIVIESFNLVAEIKKIEQMMGATLTVKHLKMSINVLPSLESATLTSDRLKVQLILLSLISNAINFTEQGQITLDVQQHANQFIIKIADTGIGIPSDKLDYIFEPFTKLSRSNEHGSHFQGVGLGLSICRQYAESLSGQITVKSQVGQGSTFTLILPQLPLAV